MASRTARVAGAIIGLLIGAITLVVLALRKNWFGPARPPPVYSPGAKYFCVEHPSYNRWMSQATSGSTAFQCPRCHTWLYNGTLACPACGGATPQRFLYVVGE